MSHAATNWAIAQKGLKPATKIVLWQLADRHNPDFGCFPSQEQLAEDCEMSRSSVNTHLQALEERGLIRRHQSWDSATRRQQRTRYILAFERGFEPAPQAGEERLDEGCNGVPCPETGHGTGVDPVSGNDGEPCPEKGESRVQNLDSNPVREPVKEPVNLREGASASTSAGAPDGAAGAGKVTCRSDGETEQMFRRLTRNWEGFAGMPRDRALTEFRKLSPADQDAALAGRDAWMALLRAQKKSHFPAPATYLKERLWEDLPAGAEAPAEPVIAAPYGKAWGAARFADLQRPAYGPPVRLTLMEEQLVARGVLDRQTEVNRKRAETGWPRVNRMQEDAERRSKGWLVSPEVSALGEAFAPVRVGSDLWRAWEALHAERGWPWFGADQRLPEYVYLPISGGTDGDDLLARARAGLEALERDLQGVMQEAAE